MNKKTLALGIAGFTILLLGISTQILKGINAWFETHHFQFNKVIELQINKPIEIKKKEVEVKEIIRVIEQIPHPEDLENPVEKYIYEVFGIEDYKIAIAIAKAESGLREEAFNTYNSNGTLDVGIFQINSVHFKKIGCSLKEVATMKGNVNCAYKIFKASGFSPWVVWNTGAFKSKYE